MNGKRKSKLEPENLSWNSSSNLPLSWNSEVGTRIREVQKQIGTVENAAKIAGVDSETLNRWMKGTTRASFVGVAQLALAAGVSLDWLATGKKEVQASPYPSAHCVDVELLRKAVEAVEMMGKNAPVERKALAIARVYERLALSQGHPDMIEMMRLIQAVLADIPYI
jgi:transcriptional regulator with XRE-family HTH domain